MKKFYRVSHEKTQQGLWQWFTKDDILKLQDHR